MLADCCLSTEQIAWRLTQEEKEAESKRNAFRRGPGGKFVSARAKGEFVSAVAVAPVEAMMAVPVEAMIAMPAEADASWTFEDIAPTHERLLHGEETGTKSDSRKTYEYNRVYSEELGPWSTWSNGQKFCWIIFCCGCDCCNLCKC